MLSAGAFDSKIRVLVVEDNLVNQKVIGAHLKKFGVEPDLAENGFEALKLLETKVYDLILMDCHMPEMDGFEATKRILADSRLR